MKILIVLFINLILISYIKGDATLETFHNYLKETEIYDFFQDIKDYLGEELAINICIDIFTYRAYCNIIIKEYMPTNAWNNVKTFDEICQENMDNLLKIADKENLLKFINQIKEEYNIE